jgi:hypothetical protein
VEVYGAHTGVGAKQVVTNRMADIWVDNCTFDGVTLYGVQVGGPGAQNIQRCGVKNSRVTGGAYPGGAGVLVQGNNGFTATTTGASITASTAIQSVLVGSSTGILPDMFVTVDTAGNAEDVYVTTVADGTHISGVFSKSHSSGVGVAQPSTGVNAVTNKGMTNPVIAGTTIVGSSSGNSQGILLDNINGISLADNDLSQAASGTGVAVLNVGSAITKATNNRGYNPVGVLSPTALATVGTGVWYANPFGVDCYVLISGGTVTGVSIAKDTAGTAASIVSGVFLLPATMAVKVTFTGTPSWFWTGL